MVDDVTVGSVSGIDAVQRPDGTFYAAVQLSLDSNVNLPANATAKVAQTSLLGSQHIELAAPADGPGRGQAGRGLEHPAGPHRSLSRPPRKCCRRWAWWSTRAISVRCKTSPTRPTTRSRAARASFTDLLPRLAELTSSLDRQTNDIIAAAEGLEPVRRHPGAQQGQPRPHAGHAARGAGGAQQQPRQHRRRVRRAAELRHRRLADPGSRRRTTSPPTSRICTRSSRRSTTTSTTSSRIWSCCRRSRSTTSTCRTRSAATT